MGENNTPPNPKVTEPDTPPGPEVTGAVEGAADVVIGVDDVEEGSLVDEGDQWGGEPDGKDA